SEYQKKVQAGTCVSDILYRSFHCYWNRPCFALTPFTSWYTYNDVYQRVRTYGTQLINNNGLRARDFVGICGDTSLEWVVADIACVFQSLITVPLHTRMINEDLVKVITNCQIKCIICTTEELQSKFTLLMTQCPSLKEIVLFKNIDDLILTDHSEWIDIVINAEDNDLLTIIHTSGSTGIPKGAMITEKLWKTFIEDGLSMHDPFVKAIFKPLCSTSERQALYYTFCSGGRVGICTEPSKIFEDIRLLQPTSLGCTPRFWNVLYAEFQCEYLTQLEKNANSCDPKSKDMVYQKVLTQFRSIFGERLTSVSTGGASTSETVKEFLIDCFGYGRVYEGYGCTEAGDITGDNGILCVGVQIKLEDIPELDYYQTDKPYPRGELWVKTRTLIPGYYNNSIDTEKSLKDGWFCTGDIVELIDSRQIKIIDRKKNFFKISQGEYVAAERLENVYLSCVYIEQIFITCADIIKYSQQQNAVMAVIIPNEKLLIDWAKNTKLESWTDIKDLCKNPIVNKMILVELKKIGERKKLRSFEIPWAIYLEYEPFTIKNGRLTSSNKLARSVVEKYYRNIMDDIVLISQVRDSGDNKKVIHDNFIANGGDSLSAVRLAALAKSNYGIEINVEKLLTSSTNNNVQLLLTDDGMLDPSLTVNNSLSENDGDILLTGCTGFLGAYILYELLKQTTNCRIWCLIRSTKPDIISQVLKYYDFCSSIIDIERIRPIIGDLSKPKFGLTNDDWSQLSSTISLIYHCGAMVNHIKDYYAHRTVNVKGTIEIIRLACSRRIRINYISTLSILPTNKIVNENDQLDELYLYRTNGYSQSKWIAEKLITQAKQRGLPVTIYRPGMISWCSTSGKCNEQDWIYRLFTGLIEYGIAPDVDSLMNLVPVDYVSKVIVWLGQQRESIGEIYHLCNMNSMIQFKTIWNEICTMRQKKSEYIDFNVWWTDVLNKVEHDKKNQILNGLLLFQNGIPNDRDKKILTKNTAKALQTSNIELSEINPTLFAKNLLDNLSRN
ncbi:unnamed protein product, partial [Didymodactylos carnosus]